MRISSDNEQLLKNIDLPWSRSVLFWRSLYLLVATNFPGVLFAGLCSHLCAGYWPMAPLEAAVWVGAPVFALLTYARYAGRTVADVLNYSDAQVLAFIAGLVGLLGAVMGFLIGDLLTAIVGGIAGFIATYVFVLAALWLTYALLLVEHLVRESLSFAVTLLLNPVFILQMAVCYPAWIRRARPVLTLFKVTDTEEIFVVSPKLVRNGKASDFNIPRFKVEDLSKRGPRGEGTVASESTFHTQGLRDPAALQLQADFVEANRRGALSRERAKQAAAEKKRRDEQITAAARASVRDQMQAQERHEAALAAGATGLGSAAYAASYESLSEPVQHDPYEYQWTNPTTGLPTIGNQPGAMDVGGHNWGEF